jgi:transcription elongation factor Elf1
MKQSLKPCPLCNGEAIVVDQLYIFNRAFVCCDNCQIRTEFCDTIAQAIDDWNAKVNKDE